jgi:hypothetical protein
MSTPEDLQQDVHNSVNVWLRHLAPRLVPHLPSRRPWTPELIHLMGTGPIADVQVHSRPVWEGNVRTIVADGQITIEKRDGDGWSVLWRSDNPCIPPK